MIIFLTYILIGLLLTLLMDICFKYSGKGFLITFLTYVFFTLCWLPISIIGLVAAVKVLREKNKS